MKQKQNIMMDALKAVRKENRETEIELYGHPICHVKVFKNKKIYSRKVKHNQRVDLSFYAFRNALSRRASFQVSPIL
jgi:uncharacterized C2H2 Zn-finger protein